MAYVIINQGLVGAGGNGAQRDLGRFLKAYDPDAHGGLGMAQWTADPAAALTFDTLEAAFETWRRQSTVAPTRPDGMPNRPLTAFSVEFVRAPHQEAPEPADN